MDAGSGFRSLACRGVLFLFGALYRCPAVLYHLTRTGDSQGVGRNVIGYGGASRGVCSRADTDRRDEVCIASDKAVVAHGAACFVLTVIIDGDTSAAEVDTLAHIAVAHISQMRNLGAFVEDGILDLHKIADMYIYCR